MPRRGVYEDPFWAYVDAHELRLQQCDDCSAWRYPPAAVCAQCLGARWAWRPLCGRGRVLAWTVFHRQYFPALPTPYAVVSVETAEGPLLMGRLLEGAPSIGLPVRVDFSSVPSAQGTWTIFDWVPESPVTV